ncbi:MAG TPA: hypothetical protein VFC79_13465 [Tissierellaceae bacterium]|nr:hypothetical protein [Tissierellaceae bacterium]
MTVGMENSYGNRKDVKLGFSWTFFFFGLFVPLIRGDMKWTGIMLGINLVLMVIGLGGAVGLVSLAFAFFYNKLYAKDLLNKGYTGITADAHRAVTEYVNN